jgi:hypothetical protein
MPQHIAVDMHMRRFVRLMTEKYTRYGPLLKTVGTVTSYHIRRVSPNEAAEERKTPPQAGC